MIKLILTYVVLLACVLIAPSSSIADVFYTDGVETHVDGGAFVLAPAHFNRPGFGYMISVVMRPDYARYMVDSFEELNLGLSFQGVSLYINDDFAYRDFCVTVRYYLNDSACRSGWHSGFLGVGLGVATVYWDIGYQKGKKRNTDYILEAGYEFDIKNVAVMSIVANFKVIDVEPVSYTGAGFVVSFGLAIDQ